MPDGLHDQSIDPLMRQMRSPAIPDESHHQGAPESGLRKRTSTRWPPVLSILRLDLVWRRMKACCIFIIHKLEEANRENARSEECYRRAWNHSLHLGLLADSNCVVRELNQRRRDHTLATCHSSARHTDVLAVSHRKSAQAAGRLSGQLLQPATRYFVGLPQYPQILPAMRTHYCVCLEQDR